MRANKWLDSKSCQMAVITPGKYSQMLVRLIDGMLFALTEFESKVSELSLREDT